MQYVRYVHIPCVLIVSYISMALGSLCLFFWAAFSSANHVFLSALKHLERLINASVLSSKPDCSCFQCLRSAGTMKFNWLMFKKFNMCIPIQTIFFQLEWFMWASMTSCRWANDIPHELLEILLSGAHKVSIISPSTCFAPGMKLGEHQGRQESWWPWIWNRPIPQPMFSRCLRNW